MAEIPTLVVGFVEGRDVRSELVKNPVLSLAGRRSGAKPRAKHSRMPLEARLDKSIRGTYQVP